MLYKKGYGLRPKLIEAPGLRYFRENYSGCGAK